MTCAIREVRGPRSLLGTLIRGTGHGKIPGRAVEVAPAGGRRRRAEIRHGRNDGAS